MKGTHGTSRSRVAQIRRTGFNISGQGRRGSGAYFWAYIDDSMQGYVRDLARHWWLYCRKNGTYSKDEDKECGVIFVSFDVLDHQMISFENQEVRERLIKYGSNIYQRLKGTEEEKTSKIYDMFVDDYEKKTGASVKVVSVKIQQPKKFNNIKLGYMSLDVTGHPLCYVVKDTSCININYVEDVDNE